MEPVFCRFDSYDFEADGRFQEGLKTLKIRDELKVLDMKLFFYNRFVEPIDQTGYKKWISASPRVTPMDRRTFSDSGSDISDMQTAETSADTEETQLSFAEVMRLVQEGKEVPGATKLEVLDGSLSLCEDLLTCPGCPCSCPLTAGTSSSKTTSL